MNDIPGDGAVEGRRPLKVRQAAFANTCAVWLSRKNITPNHISMASVGFAAAAALCLLFWPVCSNIGEYGGYSEPGNSAYQPDAWSWLLPVMAALFIQCRLLCNLFDGMVAVEGGKSTPSGELFNDIPDRIADPLILVAAGYIAADAGGWGASLGWCAGLGAVLTAYVRTLAVSIGAPADFRGPMAKQHRMALMTAACILTGFETYFWGPGYVVLSALGIIVVGCGVTLVNRCRHAYLFLENKVER